MIQQLTKTSLDNNELKEQISYSQISLEEFSNVKEKFLNEIEEFKQKSKIQTNDLEEQNLEIDRLNALIKVEEFSTEEKSFKNEIKKFMIENFKEKRLS